MSGPGVRTHLIADHGKSEIRGTSLIPAVLLHHDSNSRSALSPVGVLLHSPCKSVRYQSTVIVNEICWSEAQLIVLSS